MNYLLGKGPQPGAYSLVQEGGYPELKGMMTWSINTDKSCENSYAFVDLYDQLFNEVPQIKISNPDTIILTQEHGGIILVELKHDVFSTPINPNDWNATNLPQGVQIDSVILMNDTLAKMVLGGSSAPGTEQFHVDNVTITAAAQTFVHSSKPLSKAYGVRLTSLGYFIPTRIEAENFHDMLGSEIRPTSDTDNNTKLGGGTTGAYSTYTILVPETKKYTLDFRYATAMNNKADYSILVDGLEIIRDTLSGTGGWDSFKTITHEIELPEGKHEFSIYINLGWYGLNWFEIKEGGLNTEQLKMTPIILHPNPVSNVLHFEKEVEGTITVMNLIGEVTHQFNIAGNKVNVSRFPSGIYHLIIRTQNGNSYFGRFIKR